MSEIVSVSRSSFNKNGKCSHTHTINFSGVTKARKFLARSRAIDALYAKGNKKYPKWEYNLTRKVIF